MIGLPVANTGAGNAQREHWILLSDDGASAAYVTDVPPGFTASANLSLFYLAGCADAPWLGTVRRELLTVLRGIAAATMPTPANDGALPWLRAG